MSLVERRPSRTKPVLAETEIVISNEHPEATFEEFVEELDEEHIEENPLDNTYDDETMQTTVYVSHARTQTDPEESLLAQILAAQLHTNSLLEQLLKRDSDKVEHKPFSCPTCHAGFKKRQQLDNHLKRKFKCTSE